MIVSHFSSRNGCQPVDKNGLDGELELLGCSHNELGSQLLHRWMFPPQLVEMVQTHHSYDGIAACGCTSRVLILANLLSRWTVLKDLEEKDEAQEAAALFALLLRCGADSKIIPDETALVEMENAFRKRLEERADLLEMLKM
jgi:HD-like signal output (HDOD) protein